MSGFERSDIYLLVAIFGGIALTLLVVLYMSGLLGGWSSQLLSRANRIHGRVESFLTAVQDDRYADALALMEPRFRDNVPLTRFEQMITGDPFLATIQSGKLGRVRIFEDKTAVVSGSLSAATRTMRAQIHLVRVDGQWWMSEIVLGGRPTLRAAGQF